MASGGGKRGGDSGSRGIADTGIPLRTNGRRGLDRGTRNHRITGEWGEGGGGKEEGVRVLVV